MKNYMMAQLETEIRTLLYQKWLVRKRKVW